MSQGIGASASPTRLSSYDRAPTGLAGSAASIRSAAITFARTHRRRSDNLDAMLLGEFDGHSLYRVRWFENGKDHFNTLRTSTGRFLERFKVSA